MRVEVNETGLLIIAENYTDSWALRAIFPPGETIDEFGRKIAIHTEPEIKEAKQ